MLRSILKCEITNIGDITLKVLMLGWELPPHNSGGLGVACFHMCKALAGKGADINFIVPYTADHSDIDFMEVTSAVPASAKQVMKAGMAYESFKFIDHEGNEEWVSPAPKWLWRTSAFRQDLPPESSVQPKHDPKPPCTDSALP